MHKEHVTVQNKRQVRKRLISFRIAVQLGDEGGSEGVVKVHTELGLAYVCVDGWTDEASSIVCEQMGYQYVLYTY